VCVVIPVYQGHALPLGSSGRLVIESLEGSKTSYHYQISIATGGQPSPDGRAPGRAAGRTPPWRSSSNPQASSNLTGTIQRHSRPSHLQSKYTFLIYCAQETESALLPRAQASYAVPPICDVSRYLRRGIGTLRCPGLSLLGNLVAFLKVPPTSSKTDDTWWHLIPPPKPPKGRNRLTTPPPLCSGLLLFFEENIK